jgi:general secretion pathway protein L
MKLFVSLEKPYRWIITGARNSTVDTGVIENLENYRLPRNIDQVIGVAPGERVSCHSVQIPGKNRRNAESALPYALEEKLTEDVENLHFKLLSWQPDGVALAVVVSRADLSQWITRFSENGVKLDAIIADYFLLPQHPKGQITLAVDDNERVYVRRAKFQGYTVDRPGFEYWWESLEKTDLTFSVNDLEFARSLQNSLRPEDSTSTSMDDTGGAVSHWNIGNDFTNWLKLANQDMDISATNVLDGVFAPSHASKFGNISKFAGFVASIGIAIVLGVSVYENQMLKDRFSDLDSEIRTLFTSYFPDQPYLDRPRSQVSNLISEARAGRSSQTSFQLLLNAVATISPRQGATVDEVNYRDNSMIVLCKVKDLSSLDTIIQAFNGLDHVRAELLSSGARDGTITGRFRLTETI